MSPVAIALAGHGELSSSLSQDELLATMVEASDCDEFGVDIPTLADTLRVIESIVRTRIGSLIARGFVASASSTRYRVTAAGRAFAKGNDSIKPGPVPGRRTKSRTPDRASLHARLWRAIKRTPKFTIRQIVTLAAHDDETKAIDSARKYVRYLARAGYVKELPRRERATRLQGSNGDKVYYAIEHTGSIHPRVRKSRAKVPGMFDANLREWRPFLDDDTGAEREAMS